MTVWKVLTTTDVGNVTQDQGSRTKCHPSHHQVVPIRGVQHFQAFCHRFANGVGGDGMFLGDVNGGGLQWIFFAGIGGI